MSDFYCRPANLADLPLLKSLELSIFPDAWTDSQLLPELTAEPSHVLFLEKKDEQESRVVGYALFWQVLDELQLHRIAIVPEFQGKGLVNYLWSALLRYCISHEVRVITLEVRERNEQAQKFYRRVGFRQVGRRPRYYQDTGEAALLLDCLLVKHP